VPLLAGNTRNVYSRPAWPANLALEHVQLMPKDEDLDLLGPLSVTAKNEQLEQAANRPIKERKDLKQETPSMLVRRVLTCSSCPSISGA
jgi:hypothetical protein